MQQGEGQSVQQPAQPNLLERLSSLGATKKGREALRGLLDPLFIHFWTDVLDMAYEWFPHTKGDGSVNERTFTAIRHRVLRVGNQKKREMTMILEGFAINQVLETKISRYQCKGHGPFQLPPGVQMPPAHRDACCDQ